jgi:hypothetical protein
METEDNRGDCTTMSKEAYQDYVESTYVEPGHDVAKIIRDNVDTEAMKRALAQSDAEPGPDSILHELGECPTQSPVAQSDAARSREIGRKRRKDLEDLEAKETEE